MRVIDCKCENDRGAYYQWLGDIQIQHRDKWGQRPQCWKQWRRKLGGKLYSALEIKNCLSKVNGKSTEGPGWEEATAISNRFIKGSM